MLDLKLSANLRLLSDKVKLSKESFICIKLWFSSFVLYMGKGAVAKPLRKIKLHKEDCDSILKRGIFCCVVEDIINCFNGPFGVIIDRAIYQFSFNDNLFSSALGRIWAIWEDTAQDDKKRDIFASTSDKADSSKVFTVKLPSMTLSSILIREFMIRRILLRYNKMIEITITTTVTATIPIIKSNCPLYHRPSVANPVYRFNKYG